MAGMSVDGLVSGLGTTDLINKLVSAEGASQAALKTRLTATNNAASAYRTVNTTFLAITTAAAKLTPEALASARTASSSSSAATATATATAVPGSKVTFTVESLASTHVQMSSSTWSSPTADARSAAQPAWPIEIRKSSDGSLAGTIDIPAGATLTDAAKAINDAGKGVTASIVKLGTDKYTLQLTSTTSGADGSFYVKTATEDDISAGSSFTTLAAGKDASIKFGDGFTASSSTNTFTDLMPGLSVTVTKADSTAPVTISVGNNDDAVAGQIQALVDAVNAAVSTVKDYTNNAKGSTAALRGDFSVGQLTGQLLDAVSTAVGPGGAPSVVGLSLTKDGKVSFDKSKFVTALQEQPDLAKRIILGTPASNGADGVPGGTDDVAAVTGIAGRLAQVAKNASDSTTGTLVSLANGQDSQAKDLKARIDAWDLRLDKRRETLTRQFTAMETALSSLKNQSTWLAGQINALG
ncbi:flagellar filament capping protein FliD [Blastococcus saxobsidens]|uniref:Flagellar hook-associated protein 2 n=1 Tax=Blastococcus saxobsidens TaxID=138336 RepID=A0A6L9W139_9ACTN|nr:flagellar filament capping protein FliD [Blastococcus saxobsidens]NEK85552.1 flagellar filament capping protein FliD [Blastococcus saxobsidens]